MKRFQALLLLAMAVMLTVCGVKLIQGQRVLTQTEAETDIRVKTAVIDEIDEYGFNLGTDITHSEYISEEIKATPSIKGNTLSFKGTIQKKEFHISGKFITTNENGNLLLFDGSDKSSRYNVVYLSIERALDETGLFFRDYQRSNPDFKSMMKVILNPVDTKTLIIIEAFSTDDLVFTYKSNNAVTYDSDKANTLQSWFAHFYSPVASINEEVPTPKMVSDYSVLVHDRTYNYYGSTIREGIDDEQTTGNAFFDRDRTDPCCMGKLSALSLLRLAAGFGHSR
ncbi:MAG: hypothetical protein E7423_02555 [Ruminococcaceae bacterium]|nr:hypothetical protein [Oscillospiraceae bacterium]